MNATGGIFAHRASAQGRNFHTRTHAAHGNTSWTEEKDAILRQALEAGASFGIAAQRIGCSRNAAIGRANRLGLDRGKEPAIKLRRGPAHDVEKLNAFAEALADTVVIWKAARRIGVSRQRGQQLFARIKREIDSRQLAAGFGRWAV